MQVFVTTVSVCLSQPQNIFMTFDADCHPCAKIGDFGHSRLTPWSHCGHSRCTSWSQQTHRSQGQQHAGQSWHSG